MKTKKEKRNLKSPNEQPIRKKMMSPKLDLLRPSNQTADKKPVLGENKIKNIPRHTESILTKNKVGSQYEQKSEEHRLFGSPAMKTKFMKFKEIQKNYLTRLETQNCFQSKLSSSRRSISWGKHGDSRSIRGLTVYKEDSETIKKQKPVRFEKFAFRSQKYLRMSSEAKTLTNQEYQKTVGKLNDDISYYKNMYYKSMKALGKIEKLMYSQKNKFQEERKLYEDQIRNLKNKIASKKTNLGHIYTYKQFFPEKLIPQTLILERHDENCSSIQVLGFDHEKGEQIIEEYLNMSDNQEEEDGGLSSLSVESK